MSGRVLHVVPDDEMGGGAVIVAHLLRASCDDGRPPLALLPRNAAPAVRALFADLPHRVADYRGRGGLLEIARAVRAEARADDLIHAHGGRAALAALISRGLGGGRRVVYTVHGLHGLAQPGPLGLRTRLERLLARRVDATVFVSHDDARTARTAGLRFRGPAEVIENGVPLPATPAAGTRDVDVLFVGRLVHQKNPEAFVQTISRLSGAPRVVMIGAGERAEAVDALAAAGAPEGFRRIDGLDHAGVLALMARARLLAMTSRWEGLPTVAIEALVSGALPVGFGIGPLEEILGDAAPDCTTPHEPEALARLIDDLLADEPRRAALAGAAGRAARRRYSTRRMADAYAALYEAVAPSALRRAS